MQLLEEMEKRRIAEQSVFRAQLLKEDIGRLTRLVALAAEHPDFGDFAKAGTTIGWTRGDLRTHELKGSLDRLLSAVHGWHRGPRSDADEQAVFDAWAAFNQERMKKLVHCL